MFKRLLVAFSRKYTSHWVVLGIDIGLVWFCFIISYLIRFNLSFAFDISNVIIQSGLVILSFFLAFIGIGSFKGVVRHTGIKDVYALFNAVCLSSIIIITKILLIRYLGLDTRLIIPLSVVIINSLLVFITLVFSRFLFKLGYENLLSNKDNIRRILIYGAGDSGIITSNTLSNYRRVKVKVIGFVDDDIKKKGRRINGLNVYGSEVLNENFVKINRIDEVVFSIQNISSKRLSDKVNKVVELPVKVKIVPPVDAWINGELKYSQIKEVQIEDLLDRAPIKIINKKVAKEFEQKTIMVTGGAGSIGSELVRQICRYSYKSLVVLDQSESALYDLQQELKQNGINKVIFIVGDIRDEKKLKTYFQKYKPEIIFHAAAYKHVPLMEDNPYEAIKTNIQGTKNLVDLSEEFNVKKMVFVSTDKAVNPTNVMGATKRIAEMYISCKSKTSKTKFVITRFGNVLGSNGSVIPLFKKQIAKGGPITVTHEEITRYFMTIPEASQLVLQAGSMGNGGEIFIFDMGESVKIIDLAKNMIRLSGLNYPDDIDIKITGLRPGEKLFEELLASGENTLPTFHEKIMISKVKEVNAIKTLSQINELCLKNMFFDSETVLLMKKLIPEYISNNSIYSKFDSLIEDNIIEKSNIY